MSLMKKTPKGTVVAQTFDDGPESMGIMLAIYKQPFVVSLEHVNGKIAVVVNDEALEETGIELLHTDNTWQMKDQK